MPERPFAPLLIAAWLVAALPGGLSDPAAAQSAAPATAPTPTPTAPSAPAAAPSAPAAAPSVPAAATPPPAAAPPSAVAPASPPPSAAAPRPSATPAAKSVAKPVKQDPKNLLPAHREWLESVDSIISKAERDTFLSLEKDYQRDAFIDRFWQARDLYPGAGRNVARESWEARVEQAKSEFGSLKEDRSRIFLLNGSPGTLVRSTCNNLLWPLEAWIYPPSDRIREVMVFLFAREYGLGPFRLWEPSRGLAALFQFPGPASDAELLAAVRDTCTNGDQLASAINFVLRQGMLGYANQLRAAEKPTVVPVREWVATFNAYSTDVPADAAPLPAEITVSYPSRRQSRTVVQSVVGVTAAAATLAELGGHQSYNFLVNGEVLRGKRLFDSFRYKFDFPVEQVGEKIPLVFERLLRPGSYKLILRLEDLNGNRFFRTEVALEVPAVEGETGPPAPDPETARLLAEANAAIHTGDTTVAIIPPRGEMLAGMVRFDTLTTGDDIAQVTFSLDGKPLLTKTRPPYSVELDLGHMPRTRTLRAEAFDAASRSLSHDEYLINSSAHRFAVHFVEPQRGKRFKDSLRAEVRVELPEGEAVERVELFLDETLVATLYQEPFTQPILLPPGGQIAYLRAVAYLPDGNSTEDLVFVNAPEYLEEVEVQFVELFTSVVDRQNHPVGDLDEKEFKVFEDGVEQQLTRFEKVENLPVHVGVLLDVSASMEPRLLEAKQAALGFIESAVTPRDRAAVITFNDRPTLSAKFTSDLHTLAAGLTGLKAERGTSLYDTIVFSLFYFNGIKGQRALLLLSDGKDEGSRFAYEDTLDFARRAGVAIYTIGVDIARKEWETRRVLNRFADETGGRAYFVKTAAELPVIYQEIEKELRSRYLLAYQSSNTTRDPKFRTVEVKVERSGLEAKTLRGYYP